MDFLTAPLPFTIAESTAMTNPANLGNERLGRAMTFTGTPVGVTFDLGSAKPIDTLALIAGSGFSTATTVYWQGGATLASVTGGTPGYASGTVPYLASPEGLGRVHQQHLFKIAAPQSYRYWRAVITNPGTGTYAIGRAVLGKAFEPAEPRDYGWSTRVIDLGTNNRSRSGIEDPLIAGKVMEFSWTWGGLTDEEADDTAIELLSYAGTTRDVLFCADPLKPNLHNLIGYGKLNEPAVRTNYAEGWNDMTVQQQSRLVLSL